MRREAPGTRVSDIELALRVRSLIFLYPAVKSALSDRSARVPIRAWPTARADDRADDSTYRGSCNIGRANRAQSASQIAHRPSASPARSSSLLSPRRAAPVLVPQLGQLDPEALRGELTLSNPKRHARMATAVAPAPSLQKVFESGVQVGTHVQVADLPNMVWRNAAASTTQSCTIETM